jgi:hypothetical protein
MFAYAAVIARSSSCLYALQSQPKEVEALCQGACIWLVAVTI